MLVFIGFIDVSEHAQVVARCRPLSSQEIIDSRTSIVTVVPPQVKVRKTESEHPGTQHLSGLVLASLITWQLKLDDRLKPARGIKPSLWTRCADTCLHHDGMTKGVTSWIVVMMDATARAISLS